MYLTSVRGVTITGNYIYSGHHRNVLVEKSRNIVLGANCFGHNPDYRKNELATGIRFEDCDSCVISGVLIEDAEAGGHTVPGALPIQRDGLLELIRCRGVNVSGTQVLGGLPYGIYLDDCSDTLISGCAVLDRREPKLMKAAVQWTGKGHGNMITGCRIGAGTERTIGAENHVRLTGNLTDQ